MLLKNICDLRRRVNRFAENIDEEALRKMVRHNRKRAALSIDSLRAVTVNICINK